MAVYYTPKIVTDGLVLCLDAGSTKSYSASATTWYDLSNNSNTCTLSGGPSYNNSNNITSIVFDGVNGYGTMSNTTSLNISATISLESWIYPTKNTGTQNVICKSSQAQNTGYIYPRTENGWASSIFYLSVTTGYGWSTLTATWPSLNAWHHTVATYDGATMCVYIDGKLSSTKAQTAPNGIATNTNNLTLGTQIGYGELYGGRIGLSRVYNRALTQSEVLQNYNATKTRFGL